MFRDWYGGRVRLYAGSVLGLATLGCVVIRAPLTVDAGPDIATTTGSTVQLQAIASGGTGRYSFIWSNVAGLSDPTAPNPTYLATTVGDHFLTVTVIDSSGEAATDTIRIRVVSARQPLVADAGPNQRTPVGTAVTLQGSASGGSGSYMFAWSPGDGLSSTSAAQPTFTPTAEGTTTFTLTVTDSEGLTASDTVEVTAYVATTVSSLTWAADATGGYQVLVTFSQPVARASAEVVGAYRVHESGIAASSAVVAPDDQSVLLTFASAGPLAAVSTFDIGVAETIVDVNGNSVIAVSDRAPDTNPADTTAPTVVSYQWGVNVTSGYQVLLQFSEVMDRSTTQAVSAYRLNGAVAPQSATLAGDGQTLTLVFTGVALSPSATLDIGIGEPIRDVNGQTLQQVIGQGIAADPADTTPPTVIQALHAANFTSPGYRIDVLLSEAMSAADAENPAAYEINGVPASAAVLETSGRTVVLTFQTPIAASDLLTVGVGGLVRDINGIALATASIGVGQNGGDLTGPTILSRVWAANAAQYEVTVTFNESMDRTSATTTMHYTVTTPSGSANPTVASLDSTGKVVTLTFAATGAGLPSTAPLTVSAAVRDINGRPNATTAAAAIAPNSADTTPPAIVNVAQVDATHVDVTFSEVMDKASVEATAAYTIPTVNVIAATLRPDGRTVRLTTDADPTGQTLTVGTGVQDVSGNAPAADLQAPIP